MIIEPVQNVDLLPLAQIEKDLFFGDAFGVFLLHHYLQENILFDKILDSDNEIIGFGIITRLNPAILNPHELTYISEYESQKIAHLVDFAIKNEYWCHGYGTALLDHFESKLQKQNFDFLYLEVNSTNSRAIHFYKQRKFKTIGIIQAYYSSGHNAILMMKPLERF